MNPLYNTHNSHTTRTQIFQKSRNSTLRKILFNFPTNTTESISFKKAYSHTYYGALKSELVTMILKLQKYNTIKTQPIIIDLTNDDTQEENTRTKRNRDYDTDTYQHKHKKTRLITILDLPDSFSQHTP
jgi:hypothetical protein